MTFLRTGITLQLVDVGAVAHDVARVDEDAVAEELRPALDLGVADHDDDHVEAVEELLH